MSAAPTELSHVASAVITEEEAVLSRVAHALVAAIEPHRKASSLDGRSAAGLASLREQAGETSEEDLPIVLHDMAVRHTILSRARGQALPTPLSPYLAHLRLREGGVSRDYLLGRVTFIDTASDVRILDWRVAPVAQIFYRYREGDAYEEELPGRLAQGVVEARRIVVIEGGRLTRIVGDGLALERGSDGLWRDADRAALSMKAGGAGSAVRPGILGVGAGAHDRAGSADITALLDAEQFAAVSAPADEPLLVLGSAGSGKTTVALHRLARIVAQDPRHYPIHETRVVVPEEGLARLSRRLLAPLGAREAQVRTLDGWATDLAKRVFGAKELRLAPDTPALVVSLKRHPALFRALGPRFAARGTRKTRMQALRRWLGDALTDVAFLGAVVDDAGGELSRRCIDDTVRHTMLQLAGAPARAVAAISDPERTHGIDGRAVWEGTPEELGGTVDAEDLPILLFLVSRREGFPDRRYAHLVLDESEDFSLFELAVMRELLGKHPSVTLAGDEGQQTSSSFAGWQTSLATLGAAHAATCRLAVSYRCPRPVAELAERLVGARGESRSRAAREGAEVGVFHFPTESQAHLFAAGALGDLLEREPKAAIAVVCRGEAAARSFHELVRDLPSTRLVLRGEFSFEPGLDVTDVDNAKGLEWDYVVVPDATLDSYPDNTEARRRLHVAVTRTSHQLWVVSGGAQSPLVKTA
jgi:DNA helicase-2/ATP-dependent DNA helicase PcrA